MRALNLLFVIVCFFVSFKGVSQQADTSSISLYSNQSTDLVLNLPKEIKWLKEGWLYNPMDEKQFALKDYPDSNWIVTPSGLTILQSDKINYNGFGWFRYHLKIDSNERRQSHVLYLSQNGASEIYIDGVLIKTYGKVSRNYDSEVRIVPKEDAVYLPLKETGEYIIAVRNSNINYLDNYNNLINNFGGFEMYLCTSEFFAQQIVIDYRDRANYGWGLFIFFITIGLVHLLLFFFYTAKRSNFFFAIFCFIFSYYFLFYYLSGLVIENVDKMFWFNLILALSLPFFFVSFQSVLYSIFFDKFPKRVKVFFFAAILCSVGFYFSIAAGVVSTLVLILIITVDSIIFFIEINKKKRRGALLITFGFGIFILFIVLCFIKIITTGTLNFSSQNAISEFLLIVFATGLICIPLSMSASLAWDFAQTNKSLSKKLIEVEELSEKSIEQEKERQKILAEQNEKLERQVTERTKEINEQKKLIEEKNKDITDSINYAQRIQRSILPTDKEIKDIFENAFVLFKPRDIVSGDFYQFKKVRDYKFAVLADCTGHGVPGALMSMIGSNLLNQIIIERKILEPNKILSELHKEVKSTLRQTSGVQSHDGMDASIVLLKGKKLFISSANRPVYVVQNNELIEIKPDKRSIGGSQSSDEVEFKVTELNAEPNMMVYLFSDGYADQFGGEAGKKFKAKNLSELLLSSHDKPLLTQHDVLNKTFDNWKNQLEQVDDVCIIGIRL